MLEALRPKTATNLKELTRLSESNSQHLLYTSALSEKVLLCLARDLRQIENLSPESEEPGVSLAPSMYVIFELLMRPGTKYHDRGQFQMEETSFAQAIKVLQCAIEREIVGRIVGVTSGQSGDECFLAALDLVDCVD